MGVDEQDFPYIECGTCHVLFAFDIGLSVDLSACERRITQAKQRRTIEHKHPAPHYFEFEELPLHVTQDITPIQVADFQTDCNATLSIYDFGAVSVSYRLGLKGSFARLLSLSEGLYENEVLLSHSRQCVEQLLAVIRDHVSRPEICETVEDYCVYQIQKMRHPHAIRDWCDQSQHSIAQILRSESEPLADDEVADATNCRISFSRDDVTYIDWNAALVFGPENEDVCAVLEFANIELLEVRYLDQQLDRAMDEAYETLTRSSWSLLRVSGASRADLQRIGQLRVDGALLFEGVNNALKLIGDQFLARVYRLASQRFHLAQWDASILRKLETLDSIYERMADRAGTLRLETLEWIIILLIALSILLQILPIVDTH